ncbi:hypothetical protein ACJJTC_017463 [Scirpophaga incertulas]
MDLDTTNIKAVTITDDNVRHQQSPGTGFSAVTGSITYEQFGALLDSKLSNIRSAIKDDINAAISKLKLEFTETTDYLTALQSDMKTELELTNKRISVMETDKTALELQLNKLNSRLSTLEKVSRGCNFEIQCVPEKKSENLLTIVRNLLTEIKISNETDIKSAKRIAKMDKDSARPRGILVTLSSERDRDNVLSAYKRYNRDNKANQLSSTHIGIQGERCLMYVTEHLSPETKQLHAAARLAARNLSYKYVWVKYGRVYIRKSDDSPAIHVKNLDFLRNIKS